jgi:hypothetical protein
MFSVPDRALRNLALVAAAMFAVACSDQPTAPASSSASRIRSDFVSSPGYIIDTGPSGTTSVGSSAMFASGSTSCLPQPACAAHFQFLAGKFTLTHTANVQSVEGWLSSGSTGLLDVHIRTDSAPPAGAHVPGHSLHTAQYSVAAQFPAWKVFTGFTVTLPPGTYWLAFEPTPNGGFSGGMTGTVASPLPDYAFFGDGNSGYLSFTLFNQHPAYGFRVYGETVITTAEQITTVMAYVSGAGLTRPIVSKINGSLQKASDAVAANQTSAACTNLQDVIDYVNKQGVKKIPTSVATEIISQTNTIRTGIGC